MAHARAAPTRSAEVPAFPIEVPDGIEVRETAAEATLAALAAVDPDGARRAEFGE